MENNALDMHLELKPASSRDPKALKDGICKFAQF